LWTLMENNIEEVKVLQTVTLLLTTNTVVHGDTLAKALGARMRDQGPEDHQGEVTSFS